MKLCQLNSNNAAMFNGRKINFDYVVIMYECILLVTAYMYILFNLLVFMNV